MAPGWWSRVVSPPCVDMPGKELSSSVRDLYAPNGEIGMDVIFFHGLDFGEPRDVKARAWMSGDGSECWPEKWLPERFPGARILAVSYDSSAVETSTSGRMDVELIAENLVSDLIFDVDVAAGQGLYRPLVLVGHSVGGLVIHQLCLHAFDAMNSYRGDEPKRRRLDTFLKNLRGVFYYSTPHAGSRLAEIVPRKRKRKGAIMEIMDFQRSRAANLLARFKGLREKYKDVWTLAGVVEAGVTELPGFCDVAVDTASARIGNDFGELFTISEADHFSICRPRSRRAGSYKKLVTFLNRIQEEAKPGDMQSIWCREKFLVGLPARVQEIESILKTVPTLGLFGMGGVGKSTLARAILEACHLNFSYSCWIPDFKELVERKSKPDLERCMKEGLRHRGRELPAETVDWHILKGQTVLVVIDNVDKKCEDELDYYMRLTNGFGDQSRVIVTSRNQGFCERKFQKAFDVSGLTEKQSSELFLHHAFPLGGPSPPSHVNNRNLQRVLRFCGGLPLAIEVLGRVLHKENAEDMWEAVFRKLEEGEPASGDNDDRLLNSLRLSYDGLRHEEQKMFLDAALCLIDEPIAKALQIWMGCWGRSVPIAWRNLTFNCLVDLRYGRIWVHDSLRMLARGIACPKHGPMHTWQLAVTVPVVAKLLADASQEPCKAECLICVTRWHSGQTGLVLRGNRITQTWFPQLRVLIMESVDLLGDAIRLPSSLAYLKWSHSTCRTLPFLLGHLTRLWWLDLAECESLEFIPEHLDGLTTLKSLQLGGCRSLRFLPDAVGKLTSLQSLELRGCRSLASLPDTVGNLINLERLVLERCSSLATLPDTIGKLTSLQRLKLAGCQSLVSLPDKVGSLTNLETLGLRGCGYLTSLPDAVANMTNLKILIVTGSGVSNLSDSLGSLKKLKVIEASRTALDRLPPTIVNWPALTKLDLSHTLVTCLPESMGAMKNLVTLDLSHTKLQMLPDSITKLDALEYLYISWTPLRILPASMGTMKNMVTLDLSHTKLQILPNSITELDALKYLYISSTPLRILPERLGDLRRLVILDLSETGLHELPTSMTELQILNVVYLRGCKKLSCLPDGFENLHLGSLSLTCGDGQGIPGNLPPNSSYELTIEYHADAVFQNEMAPALPWASSVEQAGEGSEASPRTEREGEGPSELVVGAPPRASTLYPAQLLRSVGDPFRRLSSLTILGSASFVEFPRPLLQTLHYLTALDWLSLKEFNAIKRLPEEFADLLPTSITWLRLDGWRSLEELPRFVKIKTTVDRLRTLWLRRLHSLKRLPEIADWPSNIRVTIRHCENLCAWPLPPCAIIEGKSWELKTDSWVLAKDVVEKFGDFGQLSTKFSVESKKELEEVKLALSCSPYDVSSPVKRSDYNSYPERVWFDADEKAVALKALEVLRPLYGGDGDGDRRFGAAKFPIWAHFDFVWKKDSAQF